MNSQAVWQRCPTLLIPRVVQRAILKPAPVNLKATTKIIEHY